MFAIVEAEMSIRLSAPRCSRSGDSGAFVSVNGTCAASLMCYSLEGLAGAVVGTDLVRRFLVRIMRGIVADGQPGILASAFQFLRNVPDARPGAQGPAERGAREG